MRIIISGGGTAGHINPGIAVAGVISSRVKDAEFLFVGTNRGLEKDIVPREGYKIEFIRVSGFKRSIGLDTFKTIGKMFCGYRDAVKIIKRFKPDVVIGTGGYVCGPVLLAASLHRIPTLIHEQNAYMGVTNKILSKTVNTVCYSFADTEKFLSKRVNAVYTGNPVRKEFLQGSRMAGRGRYNVKPGQKLVAVVGGSRGTETVNKVMTEMINKYFRSDLPPYKLLWATGTAHYDKILSELNGDIPDNVMVCGYLYDMADVYAACDLLVCRAGANTVTEVALSGSAALFIPSPFVTANHQEYNAGVLVNRNAAEMIRESGLTADSLFEKIGSLIRDDNKLTYMSNKVKTVMRSDAAEMVASEALGLIRTL